MATQQLPDNPNQANDPAKLGADQNPETSREDDAHDMSPVLAEADKDQSPDFAGQPGRSPQGSQFDEQRREGATADGTPHSDVGQAQGMGRSGYNGDEDRTYDQNPQHGGLGSSGGRESHADRHPNADTNPYVGPGHDQPSAEQSQHLGLTTPPPAGQ